MVDGAGDDLERVRALRWRVVASLSAGMLTTYFGFLLLVAYQKAWLGTLVAPGLSVGLLLGALVIVVAWALTGIYVRWANIRYDAAIEEIRAKARRDGGGA